MSNPEQSDRLAKQQKDQQTPSPNITGPDIAGNENQVIDEVDGNAKVINRVDGDVYINETHQAAKRVTSPFQLPPAIADFTGRTTELEQVKAAIIATQGSAAVAISAVAGMAGVGKSALAIQAAHELAPQFPDARLYVNLQGADAQPRDPSTVLAEWLGALGLQGSEIPVKLSEQVVVYRSQLANKKALVVLDNAHDVAQVKSLIPGGAECAVLLTSRKSLAALPGTEQIQLKTLLPTDAETLLARLAGATRIAAEPTAAAEIVKLCGYLPLAIRIAGGVLKEKPHWRLAADYLPKLRAQRLGQFEQTEGENVRASFNLSYQQMDVAEQTLFAQLGALPGEFGQWVAAAVGEQDAEAVRESLEQLIDVQLIEAVGRRRYRYHDLMRLYARELLGEAETLAAETRAFDFYRQGAAYFDNAFNPQRRRALVKEQVKGEVSEAAEDQFVQRALDWFEVERLNLRTVFDWGHRQHKHKETIVFSCNLVGFYQIRSYWQDWEKTQLKALSSANENEGLWGKSQTLGNLGLVYRSQGRWEEAIAQYEASLEIKRSLGDKHGEGITLNNLGLVYQSQGRWEEAITQHEVSLGIFRSLDDKHGEGITLNNLGYAYQSQGRWEEAIAQHEDSLEIIRSLGDRYNEGITLTGLGSAYKSQGRWDDAIAQYEASLEIIRSLGDKHGESKNLMGLGNAYQSQGRWDDAIAQYEASLEIKRSLGDKHGEGITLKNLGDLHQARLQTYQAQEYWQAALTKLHPDSPILKHLQKQLNNPFSTFSISPKQFLIGCLPQVLLLLFASFNLIRGHWPIALLIFLAWASFLTIRLWRIRQGKK